MCALAPLFVLCVLTHLGALKSRYGQAADMTDVFPFVHVLGHRKKMQKLLRNEMERCRAGLSRRTYCNHSSSTS